MFGARYSVLTVFLLAITAVEAQINGTCVCQPGEIVFTLNFALSCDNRTIVPGLPGIEDAVCVVTNGLAGAFDNVPVSVSTIVISEVARNLDVLKSVNYTDAFVSGDTFTYEAFSVSDTDSVANGTIPNGLQVALTGLNAANEEITNNFVILYTNDCAVYPVLETGSAIGWTSLTTVEGPPEEFCPAYTPPRSDVPSSFPSSSPTLEDYCNCQPGVFSLTLDFGLTCEERNVLTGDPGILEEKCIIFSNSDPMVSDPVPVTVESVLIYELDASYDILNTTNLTDSFESGDTIRYESFSVSHTDLVKGGQIPRGLQITISGFNAAGDDISNSFVIVYTNQCDVYPVLTDSSVIGWTRLGMVTGPPNGLCPAFDSVSTVPSIVPSSVPIGVSVVPSIVPSNVPMGVSVVPSNEPSSVPIGVSVVPSILPSNVPMGVSVVPSNVPSSIPVNLSTLPSIVPVIPETEGPAATPVVPPVITPVVPPVVSAPTPVVSPVVPAPTPVEPPEMVPVEPPSDTTAPSCPPIGKGKGGKGGKGKGGKGKGGKGKGDDSERRLRTGGGVDECPEPEEKKMKKKKGKDNMSMDIKKKKGKKVSNGEKGKDKNEAPKSKEPSKVGNTGSMGNGLDGEILDDSNKGKMGIGKDKKAKGDKVDTKKMMKERADKKMNKGDKERKMDNSEGRQLRSLPQ